MKPIKINEANAIEIALKAINGRSEAHAFVSWQEIEMVAEEAESTLDSLGLQKAARNGAIYCAVSGGAVPNAYRYQRTGTHVRLERNTSGWRLAEITQVNIPTGGGKGHPILTPKQDAILVANLRHKYTIAICGPREEDCGGMNKSALIRWFGEQI